MVEIDGLPIKNGGSFHGYVTNNQMVFFEIFMAYQWTYRDIQGIYQWDMFATENLIISQRFPRCPTGNQTLVTMMRCRAREAPRT